MSESGVRVTLLVVAAFELAAGLLIWISPGTYFDNFGTYGIENDHYVRFLAAGLIAPGVGLFIAADRGSWRVPLLVVGAILNALLAIQALIDVGDASSTGRGLASTFGFGLAAIGAAFLAWVSAGLESEKRR